MELKTNIRVYFTNICYNLEDVLTYKNKKGETVYFGFKLEEDVVVWVTKKTTRITNNKDKMSFGIRNDWSYPINDFKEEATGKDILDVFFSKGASTTSV